MADVDANDASYRAIAIGGGGEGGTIVQLPAPPPPKPAPAPAPEIAATFSSGASTAPVSNVIPPHHAGTVAMAVAGRDGDDSTRSAAVDGVVTSGRLDPEKKISRMSEGREERRRELLLEARAARVEWILDDGGAGTGRGDEPTDDGGNGATSDLASGPMGRLRACRPDILPCAPLVVERMLSSSGPRRRHRRHLPPRGAAMMLNVALDDRELSWEDVSDPSIAKGGNERKEEKRLSLEDVVAGNRHPSLDLPHVPDPVRYNAFLHALCEPPAADLVMSIQKFCTTIAEAAGVMVSSIEDEGGDGTGGDPKEAEITAKDSVSGDSTSSSSRHSLSHGASLAKAVRGFVNTTMREIEVHSAFRDLLHMKRQASGTPDVTDGEEEKTTLDPDAREQILASLEQFVHSKCRGDVYAVLLAGKEIPSDTSGEGVRSSTETMREREAKLHEKMMSLQFVTPAHLEIQCLKSCNREDVDLSYSVSQLRSVCDLASPRQMLRAVLLAHRGITVALDKACGGGNSPGADDILPTLILAALRAHPRNLTTVLRFIEHFAPLPLLRGEAGYAYTNLCGAMQFLRELDVEGHAAEVALGVAGEGAVLSIGPEEFRVGLEGCRRMMNKDECKRQSRRREEEGGEADDPAVAHVMDEGYVAIAPPPEPRITARDVREALFLGEVVDLEWALQKQGGSALPRSGASGSDAALPPRGEGDAPAAALAVPDELRGFVPPEEPPLPSRFSRSYPFLVARPEDIGVCDLPLLLRDYKMLVHATEKLLNERAVWRESERKRQLRLEREYLERDFDDVIGTEDDDVTQLNGY